MGEYNDLVGSKFADPWAEESKFGYSRPGAVAYHVVQVVCWVFDGGGDACLPTRSGSTNPLHTAFKPKLMSKRHRWVAEIEWEAVWGGSLLHVGDVVLNGLKG